MIASIILFILLIFSAIIYQKSTKILSISGHRYISYSEKAIKTQLFILSKLMICAVLCIAVFIIQKTATDYDCSLSYKIFIPFLLLLFWFVIYKIEPSAFYGFYTEGKDSGYNVDMFSVMHSRRVSIRLLLIGLAIITLSLMVMPLYYLFTVNKAQTIMSYLYCIANNELANDSFIFKAIASTNISFLIIFSTFCLLTSIINAILALVRLTSFIKKNKPVLTRFLIKCSVNIAIKRVILNVISAVPVAIVLIYAINTYKCALVPFELGLAAETIELPDTSNIVHILYALSIITFIVLAGFMILTSIKLLMLYRHQKKVAEGIIKQSALSLSDEDSAYKNWNFIEKLIDFQTTMLRYIYDPVSLANKNALKKALISYSKYIEYLDCCKLCIFMGTPLALTGSITLAFTCYKAQLQAIKSSSSPSCKQTMCK